jgi:hypothetical protein
MDEFMKFWLTDPRVLAWRKQLAGRDLNEQEAIAMLSDPNGRFDYRKAWEAGDAPRPTPYGEYHWGSSGKLPGHPTMWKEKVIRATGVNPDENNFSVAPPDMTRAMIAMLLSQKLAR